MIFPPSDHICFITITALTSGFDAIWKKGRGVGKRTGSHRKLKITHLRCCLLDLLSDGFAISLCMTIRSGNNDNYPMKMVLIYRSFCCLSNLEMFSSDFTFSLAQCMQRATDVNQCILCTKWHLLLSLSLCLSLACVRVPQISVYKTELCPSKEFAKITPQQIFYCFCCCCCWWWWWMLLWRNNS